MLTFEYNKTQTFGTRIMIPGPIYVYECSACAKLLKRGSEVSGNTFRTRFYSDGCRGDSRLLIYPELIRCNYCQIFLWISKLKEVGTYHWRGTDNTTWQQASFVNGLSIEEYFEALSLGIAQTQDEKLVLRRNIWWSYNDRIREDIGSMVIYSDSELPEDKKQIFQSLDDEKRYTDNCRQLLRVLNERDSSHRVTMAELHRNLGEFDTCISLIESIQDDEFDWLKDSFIQECRKKNRALIEL